MKDVIGTEARVDQSPCIDSIMEPLDIIIPIPRILLLSAASSIQKSLNDCLDGNHWRAHDDS
jgi:hypothetical protein